MKTAGKLALATIPALVVLGFFTYFANWIPQSRWEPPTKKEVSVSMTPYELSAIGKTIVQERGCLACHTLEPGVGVKGGGRGPNLFNIAQRRAQRVPGGSATLSEYLAQSLYDPSAYVVEGYANIMPAAIAPPTRLSYEEATAVAAYLQSLGGTPTVRVGDLPHPSTASPTPTPQAGEGQAPADPLAILQSNCLACHSLRGQERNLGPTLDNTGRTAATRVSGQSAAAYIRQAILEPGSFVVSGFPNIMPGDFGSKLSSSELDALVAYLLALGGQ